MALRSYSFGTVLGHSELPVEVIELFLDLSSNPEKKIEYASEIVFAGLQKRIRCDGTFVLDAYERTIRKNEKLGKENRRKRECSIDYSRDTEDEAKRDGSLVSVEYVSSHVVEKITDAYEQLIFEDELRYAISTIKKLQPVLLVSAKIDILHTIKQALKGLPDSIELLQQVCSQYDVVAEQIKVILGSGYQFQELFA